MTLKRVLIVYPNLPMMLTPAVSVGIFTAICKEKGVSVDLFETTAYTDDLNKGMVLKSKLGSGRSWKYNYKLKPTNQLIPDFVKKVEEYNPDLLLLSVVEDCFKDAEMLLESVHHLNIPHIVGGVLPMNDPEFCLSSKHINTICRYEGEEVLREVIEKWPNYKEVKGLNYNSFQPLTNINSVVPDYSLYPDERFMRPMGGKVVKAIQLETYRGCPYACTYCNSPTSRMLDKNFVRQKKLETVRKELDDYIEKYDPNYWFIIDDSFTARPKKDLIALCKLLGEYKIPWWCNTRIEAIDEEILAAMKEGYCDRIQFGIECGNDEYRIKVLKRNITNKRYYEKIPVINNSGIPYGLNVIIGMPDETEEMVFETVDLVKRFGGYDGISVSIFIPYRGTELRKYAVEKGYMDKNWYSQAGYLGEDIPLKMPNKYLQNDRIWDLANKFKYFSFFDKTRWPEIERGTDLEEEYNKRFYSKFALSGVENIRRRWGCEADDYCYN